MVTIEIGGVDDFAYQNPMRGIEREAHPNYNNRWNQAQKDNASKKSINRNYVGENNPNYGNGKAISGKRHPNYGNGSTYKIIFNGERQKRWPIHEDLPMDWASGWNFMMLEKKRQILIVNAKLSNINLGL